MNIDDKPKKSPAQQIATIAITFMVVIYMVYLISPNSSTTGENTTNTISQSSDIKQIGYWKNDRDRVFTFSIGPSVSESQVKAHARKQMYTSGKITYVFYYKSDIQRIPDPTLAKSMNEALMITEREKEVYSYVKLRNGVVSESSFNRN
jgi:hypothetical protein